VEEAAKRTDPQLLKDWNTRWEGIARHSQASTFKMDADWRFITGLGRKGPLEVGFTFHRYGFPIIPGSSVKGVARAWALLLGGKTEDDSDFQIVFGYATDSDEGGATGHAVFLDAIPDGKALPVLEIDIMNPHYPKYYQSDEFPTNWQSPVPVRFLTVAADTVFRFAVGWRGVYNKTQHDLAVMWLKNGLMELGAGAKTSAGYGYFITEEEAQTRRNPKRIHYGEASVPAIQPESLGPTQTAKGKVRYEKGKPAILDETADKRYPVNWQKLHIDAMADKTLVIYEYHELRDGNRRIVSVKKRNAA
jgi:CRISPR-associated protein Cmr6